MIIHGHHFYQFVWSTCMHMSKTEDFKSKLKFYTFYPKIISPLALGWGAMKFTNSCLITRTLLSRCSKPNLLKSDPVVLKRREEDLNRRTTTDSDTPKAITEVTWVTHFFYIKNNIVHQNWTQFSKQGIKKIHPKPQFNSDISSTPMY